MTDDEMRVQIAQETAGLSGLVVLLEHPKYAPTRRWFRSVTEFLEHSEQTVLGDAIRGNLRRIDADLSISAELERLLPEGASVEGEWINEEEETVLVAILLP
jgi:hypothetical protein